MLTVVTQQYFSRLGRLRSIGLAAGHLHIQVQHARVHGGATGTDNSTLHKVCSPHGLLAKTDHFLAYSTIT